MSDSEIEHLSGEVPESMAGLRLDQALAQLFNQFSRSRLQEWLKQGWIKVDGEVLKGREKVWGGEQIEVSARLEAEGSWVAQAIDLDIVYEDESILVINKEAGLVVHPAAGNPDGTLLNALLHHCPELSRVPRAGIVHRLDKDTTGLLVVAKTLPAQTHLVDQLQKRAFLREYLAVVQGVVTAGGTVDAPIGRHPKQRQRMAVVPVGKHAVSHYRVAERFREHTLISVKLETGRTHQIRVHMASIRYPLVGDPVYGGRLKLPKDCQPELAEMLRGFKRQALHATRLGLVHPESGENLSWKQPLPEDMETLVNLLEKDRDSHLDEYWDEHGVGFEDDFDFYQEYED